MVKRRLGSALAARSYQSQNRETALRLLVHNLTILLCLRLLRAFQQSRSGPNNPNNPAEMFFHASPRQGRTDLSPKPQGLGEQTPPPSFFLLSEAPQGRLNDVSIAPVGAHGVFGAGIL